MSDTGLQWFQTDRILYICSVFDFQRICGHIWSGRHLFKNFKNAFRRPTFSVCSFTALPFKTNTLLSLGSLATPQPLLRAPLNQWLSSCQPLIMFSAHFLSLARLHLSLKIHKSSCDHGTSPRIPLSTSGREGGGGWWSTKTVRIWNLLEEVGRGGNHFNNMG